MAIKIVIYDEKTRKITKSTLREGDFTVIATQPCTVLGMKQFPDTREVLVRIGNFQFFEEHISDKDA